MDSSLLPDNTVRVRRCQTCGAVFPLSYDLDKCLMDSGPLLIADSDPLIGTLVSNRFEMRALLGSGSWGSVYQAHDTILGRNVAVKVLHNFLAKKEASTQRFQKESETVSRLNHPNIVTIHDRGILANKQPFIVMEFLNGISLQKLIEQEGRLEFKRALNIIDQICEGLHLAHLQGVVHRDLKPDNVVILNNDHVKLVDFGLATEAETSSLSISGSTCGTPQFMSPEQCRGGIVDARSDIYCLGLIIFYMLSGRLPFKGDTMFQVMSMHVHEPAPSISKICPDVPLPVVLDQVALRCLSKQPEERFKTCLEVKEALQTGINTQAQITNKQTRTEKQLLRDARIWAVGLVASLSIYFINGGAKETNAVSPVAMPLKLTSKIAPISFKETVDSHKSEQIAGLINHQPEPSAGPHHLLAKERYAIAEKKSTPKIAAEEGRNKDQGMLDKTSPKPQDRIKTESTLLSDASKSAAVASLSNPSPLNSGAVIAPALTALPPLSPAESAEILARGYHVMQIQSDAEAIQKLAILPIDCKVITFARSNIGAPTVKYIANHFTGLKTLAINQSSLSDSDILALNGYPLRVLVLQHTRITDAALAQFNYKDLVNLVLDGDAITDKGAQLIASHDLQGLDLRRTAITAACADYLAGMSDLQVLAVGYTPFDDASVQKISRLESLETLDLESTSITDAAVDSVVRMMALNEISLANTDLTTAGIAKLQKCVHLRRIDLTGYTATPELINALIHIPGLQAIKIEKPSDELVALLKGANIDISDDKKFFKAKMMWTLR